MIAQKIIVIFCLTLSISCTPVSRNPWHLKKVLLNEKNDTHNEKIVGGEEVTPHSYPFQAALYVDEKYFCGGILISSEWVLTAAHCMQGAKGAKITLGAHNIQETEPTQLILSSSEFHIHEKYNMFTIHNDIAVVKFYSPIQMTDAIQPAKLPKQDEPDGTMFTATGWGFTSDSGPIHMSVVLLGVDVPSISNEKCSEYFGESAITDGNLCIDSTGGKGTCQGDSGGPLSKDGIVYGITSFGPAECEGGAPHAFTRIYHYLDWIENKTGVKI